MAGRNFWNGVSVVSTAWALFEAPARRLSLFRSFRMPSIPPLPEGTLCLHMHTMQAWSTEESLNRAGGSQSGEEGLPHRVPLAVSRCLRICGSGWLECEGSHVNALGA